MLQRFYFLQTVKDGIITFATETCKKTSTKIDRKVEIEDRCSLTKNKSNFNIKLEENMDKGELYYMRDLSEIRNEIDSVDAEIVALYENGSLTVE